MPRVRRAHRDGRSALVVARLALSRRRSRWKARRVALRVARSRYKLPARAAIAAVAHECGLDASQVAAIFRRGAYTKDCWVKGGEGEWLIEHVATLSEYRGRGLVQALVEHALAAGRRAGFERASISFLIGNEAAERSYAKAGFVFAEERGDASFEALTGAPGFRRFVRAI